MALFVVFSHEPDETNRYPETEWHILEKLRLTDKQIDSIVEVQADGDELDFVITHCTGIPVALVRPAGGMPRRYQRWFGDHAKFIVANLVAT